MTLNLTELLSCEIWGSDGGVYENDYFVANDDVNFWQMKNFSFSLLISTIFVAQKPNSTLGCLIVKVSRSHTQTIGHKHLVGLLWTSDQLVAEVTTYTTHNKNKSRISTPSMESEPAILAIDRPQAHTLDRTTTGISHNFYFLFVIIL